jgi:mono/diheme cytochrome c family protein
MKMGWMLAAALVAGCGGEDEGSSNRVPDADAGGVVYAANCTGCHGPDGSGNAAFPAAPRLDSAALDDDSDTELRAKVRDGDGAMPAFGGTLTEDQIADVIAFVRTLGN